jgi:hypothetical protein
MLWPEKRDKDELLGDKIPGEIDRTTGKSYLKISFNYLPHALQQLRGIARFFPWLIDDDNQLVQIGPIPAGTPVGLLTNLNLLSESPDPAKHLKHDTELVNLVLKINADLLALPPGASEEDARKVFAGAVERLFELSKCPDFIVNPGHYFGTNTFAGGEPGLSDEDKRSLIAFQEGFRPPRFANRSTNFHGRLSHGIASPACWQPLASRGSRAVTYGQP